jgi:hypothetical protein
MTELYSDGYGWSYEPQVYQPTEWDETKREQGFITNMSPKCQRRRVFASRLAGLLTRSHIWFGGIATDNRGRPLDDGSVAMWTTEQDLGRFWHVQRRLCKLLRVKL